MHVDDTHVKTTERIVYDKANTEKQPIFETKNKGTFQSYLRTDSNETTTLFTVHSKKGADGVARDEILPKFTGIIRQDFKAKFRKNAGDNAFCHAHLDKELKSLQINYNCEYTI